jgi:hypothetical protein
LSPYSKPAYAAPLLIAGFSLLSELPWPVALAPSISTRKRSKRPSRSLLVAFGEHHEVRIREEYRRAGCLQRWSVGDSCNGGIGRGNRHGGKRHCRYWCHFLFVGIAGLMTSFPPIPPPVAVHSFFRPVSLYSFWPPLSHFSSRCRRTLFVPALLRWCLLRFWWPCAVA